MVKTAAMTGAPGVEAMRTAMAMTGTMMPGMNIKRPAKREALVNSDSSQQAKREKKNEKTSPH